MPEVRLSILAVSSEPPWPLDSGGHLRTYHLLSRLAARHQVGLVVGRACHESARSALEAAGVVVHAAAVPTPSRWRQMGSAVGSFARRQPYVMYGRHYRPQVSALIRNQIAAVKPDIAYLDHLDAFVYFRDAAKGPARPTLVGDLHNVYSLVAARTAAETPNRLRGRYLAREARLLARAEGDAARRADLLMVVSAAERDYFVKAGALGVAVVPNGVDCWKYAHLPAGRTQGPPLIVFLGTMSWEPNALAAEFLALSVLPLLAHTLPTVRLRIVGKDPPHRVRRLAADPRVEVTGSVPDVLPHLSDAHVLAVPLRAGGGTRLKILEAFAAGLPVISTPVGCEGIDAEPGRHLVVAELAQFATALRDALANPHGMQDIAQAARRLATAHYDWDSIGERANRAILDAHSRRVRS